MKLYFMNTNTDNYNKSPAIFFFDQLYLCLLFWKETHIPAFSKFGDCLRALSNFFPEYSRK
jgi:hypothetical protein